MTEENLDVIRRGYEAFGRGDINALLESFDDEILWVTPGPRELATSGNRTGRQAVAAVCQANIRQHEIWTLASDQLSELLAGPC